MKTNPRKAAAIGCLVLFVQISILPLFVRAQQTNSQDIVAKLDQFEKLNDQERESLLVDNWRFLHNVQELLLSKVKPEDSEDNNISCCAIFLLGEYRFPKAADALAKIINFKAKPREQFRERIWSDYPAKDALVKIGNPSIPALIRNLTESNDAQIRDSSLKVLNAIDGDKDIVQLRLQKALGAQSDPQKKASLQSALTALLDPKFGK